MDKLTIEQKAQRYDEAIKKLRDFYRDYDTVSCLIDVKEELANLLPELKEEESEDERIRKGLIEGFQQYDEEECWRDIEYLKIKDILAWLEKQGEQKPTEWEPKIGDTFRKKGTTSPTYHLCDKQEDGITFGFIENHEVGIIGGEITLFTLKQNYELVERPKSIEDVVKNELNKTCTNTFIKKACEFLDGCIPDYIELKHANSDTFINVNNKRFIKDFKKYMEKTCL